jgi:hypothetical protein
MSNKKIFKSLGSALNSISFKDVSIIPEEESESNLNNLINILSEIKTEEEREIGDVFSEKKLKTKKSNKKPTDKSKKSKSKSIKKSKSKSIKKSKNKSSKSKKYEWNFLV